MGAMPPNKTEIRVELHGDFKDQVNTALEAFSFFGLPSIPIAVSDVIMVS